MNNSLLIGRSSECDLRVYHESISRVHCRLSISNGEMFLEDLHSGAGTFVSGRRVSRVSIRPGDDVKLAGLVTLDWQHPILATWLNNYYGGSYSRKNGVNPATWIIPSAAIFVTVLVILFTGLNSVGVHTSGSGSMITGEDGMAYFTDSGTGELVEISVVDENRRPLEGIQVDFVDGNGFETFVAFDPEAGIPPSMRIFPHNSSHVIEMLTVLFQPSVEEMIPGSEYYDGVMLFADFIEDIAEGEGEVSPYSTTSLPDNWMYRGIATQEEIDQENQMILMLLKLTPIGDLTAKVSEIGGKVMDVLEAMELLERPELYHVFVINPSESSSENLAGTIHFIMPVGQEFDLEADPGIPEIQVSSYPSGATVYFDGANTGLITPAVIEDFEGGNHRIRLYMEGYNEFNSAFNIQDGASHSINARMQEPEPPLPVFDTNLHNGQTFNDNVITVSGTVMLESNDGSLSSFRGASAILTINGVDQEISVGNGHFSQEVSIPSGFSTVSLRANSYQGDTGLSTPITINGDFSVPDIEVTLTWNTPTADIDLHVWNPLGEHSSYTDKEISDGFLDIDDVDGWGPETFTCERANSGTYIVKVNSYNLDQENYSDVSVVIYVNGDHYGSYGPHRFSSDDGNGTTASAWWEVTTIRMY